MGRNQELETVQRDVALLRQEHALFLRAVAHELRTPLQPLQGLAELAEAGQPPEQLAANLDVIKHETARLVALVDDLSLRSELESGSMSLSSMTFSLESVLEELARTMERYYPSRLEVEYDDLPPVLADQEHVRRILWMLLLNGMRYSSANDLICLSAQPDYEKTQLSIFVRDTGAHLPLKYREAIFEPLAEMPKLLKRPRFGLGLGLYVAREIARRMGGDLWLQASALPKGKDVRRGNTFVLSLRLG